MVEPVPVTAHRSQRWMARLAWLTVLVACLVLLGAAGLFGSIALLLAGAVAAGACLAGAWWFLTHRGLLRWIAAVVVVGAPIAVAVMFAHAGLIWALVVFGALWMAALPAARFALTHPDPAAAPEREVEAPKRPFVI